MPCRLTAWIAGLAIMPVAAFAQSAALPTAAGVSTTAERIYEAARPRLIQVRSVLAAQDKQSSLGSAFVVSTDGLAITNYHVVSQYALEPETYRLDWAAADDRRGSLTLLAVDVADDLAVVRLDHPPDAVFEFNDRAIGGTLAKGEQLYAMGNPMDLGFSIVEGTYNGPVQKYYQERLHFSGALNPGMSGGPTVDADGRVVGVNVAKQVRSELVSFLVPARFARALLARAGTGEPPAPAAFRAEIGRQLVDYQAQLYQSLAEGGFKPAPFGPYAAPESPLSWFTCWGGTNADQVPAPRAASSQTSCYSSTGLFVASDLGTGSISLSHAYLKSVDLNAYQFASYLEQASQMPGGYLARKWHTHEDCRVDFTQAQPAAEHPVLRVRWCARAYRKFPGLYDVSVVAATQDRTAEALISRLTLQGASWDNAQAVTRSFLDGIRWSR